MKKDAESLYESVVQESIKIEDAPLYSCAFTGHRAIKPEHEKLLAERLARAVEYAYSRGCRVFYCGGALGFDTMAAREVIRFSFTRRDVVLRLVLPCQNQDELWTERQRESYFYILQNAESVEYISNEYTPECMKKRNLRLAELCDILIAYLYKSGSGSSQTVRLAKKLGKEVYNISPSGEI